MLKLLLLAFAIVLAPLPARAVESATQLTLTLPGNAQTVTATYQCEGTDPIEVQYVNAAPLFLAFVPVAGERQLFVNVISASGARYASGQYEWWTKGPDATLTDLTAAEGTAPVACTESSETP